MSYTDNSTVQEHMLSLKKPVTVFETLPIEINNSGVGTLPHKAIVSESEKVKQIAVTEPVKQASVTMDDETWQALNDSDLVVNEVVVAYDDGLQTIYKLDQDYAVNWKDGKIRRISGGSISNGQNVVVYYMKYEVFEKNTDYTIDYAAGEIEREAGGDLQKDSRVWIDYETSVGEGADQLIDSAITEAEDKIIARLSDDYDAQSQNQGLKTGSTELAVSIVCRGLASSALADGEPSAEARSRGWRELSIMCENSAWITLQPFLAVPILEGSRKKTNSSWNWS